MKESELKSIVKEIVRECVKEACGGGHLAGGEKGKRMFKHIKQGYKGEKDPEDAERIAAATVNKNLGEAGLTSEEDKEKCDGEDHDYDEGEEIKLIKALNLITKRLLDMHKRNKSVDEASYKQVSPNETDTAKENKPLTIQTDPKVTESNHKVQHRSFKTAKDGDQNPKNVRDPKVPQA